MFQTLIPRSRFSGLISLWMTFFAWQYFRAWANCRIYYWVTHKQKYLKKGLFLKQWLKGISLNGYFTYIWWLLLVKSLLLGQLFIQFTFRCKLQDQVNSRWIIEVSKKAQDVGMPTKIQQQSIVVNITTVRRNLM